MTLMEIFTSGKSDSARDEHTLPPIHQFTKTLNILRDRSNLDEWRQHELTAKLGLLAMEIVDEDQGFILAPEERPAAFIGSSILYDTIAAWELTGRTEATTKLAAFAIKHRYIPNEPVVAEAFKVAQENNARFDDVYEELLDEYIQGKRSSLSS